MSITGAILGGALSLGSSLWSGYQASQANKKANKMIQEMKDENQSWYDRRYNEDATQRADAQRLLQMTEDSIKKRNQQASGVNAVIGGSTETAAAMKQANNQALADATASVVANNESRKDAIEQQYLNSKNNLNQQQIGVEQQKANNIISAGNQGIEAGATIGSGIDLDDWTAKKLKIGKYKEENNNA